MSICGNVTDATASGLQSVLCSQEADSVFSAGSRVSVTPHIDIDETMLSVRRLAINPPNPATLKEV
eukprot:6455676-Amphidinium_carterae.1